jgi:glutamate N-acetyltransferase / amino-acid N-acetyltransferase
MSVTDPRGFRAAGATAGLKPSGKPDVALVVNDGPRRDAAAVFTTNRCRANPVLWSERVLADGHAGAVVLNSGGANCYTGAPGFRVTHSTAELVGRLLGLGAVDVAVCSTGMIGQQLDHSRLMSGVEAAVGALTGNGGVDAAIAIMTTDTRPKQAVVSADGWSLGGMAKGAGMLAPGLATMLVVLTTDADVDAKTCEQALRDATRVTFDRLDSDGCMSTNDTVLLMASGASALSPGYDEFAAAVRHLCTDLAMQLLADAEGSEHDIAITVVNAACEDDAVVVGRSVARSALFKTAVYGRDPNWGRILASVGTTAAAFEPGDLDVAMNGVWICRNGGPAESRELVDMADRAVAVIIDLKSGIDSATVWTNDLTHAYVHENSAYST